MASSAGPAQTCGRLRPEVPKPSLNSGPVGGERRSGRHRPPSQASAPGSGHWRPPWRCGRLCAAVWRVCGRGGGIARRGPAVGVAVSGSRPPGVVPPVRLEFPILSLNPGLRHRCVALGVWPPGATDAVRVQGTHLIPLSPGASTAITELQFGGAPEAAPPPPSGHGRAGTTSVPRASAPPDTRTAGPAPAPTGSFAGDVARSPRAAGQPSRHGITARPAASVAVPGPHRRTRPSPPGRSRRSGASAGLRRADSQTARWPAPSPGRPR